MKNREILILTALLLILAAFRLYSPWPNFNPIGAIALMGGILFAKRSLAVSITFGALLLGDALLAINNELNADYLFSISFLFVYLALATIILIGIKLANKPSILNVVAGSFMAAIAFFLISNFGSWLSMDMYPKTLSGLGSCMSAGLPFFRATLTSQLLFSLVIYAIYNLATSRKFILA